MDEITYRVGFTPDIEEIINLYISSGIIRPIGDFYRIKKMYENSNLIITAWDSNKLIGIARSLTDYCYACYLSDLAVCHDYKGKGVGSKLLQLTKEQIGSKSMLLLLSSANAMSFYNKLGLTSVNNGFIIYRDN